MSPTHSRAGGIMPRYHAAAGGSGSAAAYETAVLADSPWGFWKMREASGTTLADASGNSRPMTVVAGSSPSFAQAGPDGSTLDAISWPAVSSATNLANTAATIATSTATLEAIFKITATPAFDLTILGFSAGYNGSTYDKELFIFNGTTALTFYCYTGTQTNITSSPLSLNTWYHAIGSVGAAGMKLRINKVTAATNAATSSYSGGQNVFVHGGSADHGTRCPAAIIGPCAVWTTQLTDTQTDAHAAAMGF